MPDKVFFQLYFPRVWREVFHLAAQKAGYNDLRQYILETMAVQPEVLEILRQQGSPSMPPVSNFKKWRFRDGTPLQPDAPPLPKRLWGKRG